MNTGITVKGFNGQLVFVVNENLSFDEFIIQIESLLDRPLFKNNGMYPKALFDFKCRILSDNEFDEFIQLILKKQVVLFGGIVGLENNKPTKMEVIKTTVRAGQELYIEGDALILGNINPGATVKVEGTLYVMGRISGHVEGIYETSKINGQHFDRANIKIHGVYRQDFTSLELSVLYYKNSELMVEKGEMVYV